MADDDYWDDFLGDEDGATKKPSAKEEQSAPVPAVPAQGQQSIYPAEKQIVSKQDVVNMVGAMAGALEAEDAFLTAHVPDDGLVPPNRLRYETGSGPVTFLQCDDADATRGMLGREVLHSIIHPRVREARDQDLRAPESMTKMQLELWRAPVFSEPFQAALTAAYQGATAQDPRYRSAIIQSGMQVAAIEGIVKWLRSQGNEAGVAEFFRVLVSSPGLRCMLLTVTAEHEARALLGSDREADKARVRELGLGDTTYARAERNMGKRMHPDLAVPLDERQGLPDERYKVHARLALLVAANPALQQALDMMLPTDPSAMVANRAPGAAEGAGAGGGPSSGSEATTGSSEAAATRPTTGSSAASAGAGSGTVGTKQTAMSSFFKPSGAQQPQDKNKGQGKGQSIGHDEDDGEDEDEDGWTDARGGAGAGSSGQAAVSSRSGVSMQNWSDMPSGLDSRSRQARFVTVAAYSTLPYFSGEGRERRESYRKYLKEHNGHADALRCPWSTMWRMGRVLSVEPLAEAVLQAAGTIADRQDEAEGMGAGMGSSSPTLSLVLLELLLSLTDLAPLAHLLVTAEPWRMDRVTGVTGDSQVGGTDAGAGAGASSSSSSHMTRVSLGEAGERDWTSDSLAAVLAEGTGAGLNTLWFLAYHYHGRAAYYEGGKAARKCAVTLRKDTKLAGAKDSKSSHSNGRDVLVAVDTPDLVQAPLDFYMPGPIAMRSVRRLVDPLHLEALRHADPPGWMWPQMLLQSHADGWLPCRNHDPELSPYHEDNRIIIRPVDRAYNVDWPAGWRLSTDSHDLHETIDWMVNEHPPTAVFTRRDQDFDKTNLRAIVVMPPTCSAYRDQNSHPAAIRGLVNAYLYSVPYAKYEELQAKVPDWEQDDQDADEGDGDDDLLKRMQSKGLAKHRIDVGEQRGGKELHPPKSHDFMGRPCETVSTLTVKYIAPYQDGPDKPRARQVGRDREQAEGDQCWAYWRFLIRLFDGQLKAGILPPPLPEVERQARARVSRKHSMHSTPARGGKDVLDLTSPSSATGPTASLEFPSQFAEHSGDTKGGRHLKDIISYHRLGTGWPGVTTVRGAKGRTGSKAKAPYVLQVGDVVRHRHGEGSHEFVVWITAIRQAEAGAGGSSGHGRELRLVGLRRDTMTEITLGGSDPIRYEGMANGVEVEGPDSSWVVRPEADTPQAKAAVRYHARVLQVQEVDRGNDGRLWAMRWAWTGAEFDEYGRPRGAYAAVPMDRVAAVQLVVEYEFLCRLMEASKGFGSRASDEQWIKARHACLQSLGVSRAEAYHSHGWADNRTEEDRQLQDRIAEMHGQDGQGSSASSSSVPRRIGISPLRKLLIELGIRDDFGFAPLDAATGKAATTRDLALQPSGHVREIHMPDYVEGQQDDGAVVLDHDEDEDVHALESSQAGAGAGAGDGSSCVPPSSAKRGKGKHGGHAAAVGAGATVSSASSSVLIIDDDQMQGSASGAGASGPAEAHHTPQKRKGKRSSADANLDAPGAQDSSAGSSGLGSGRKRSRGASASGAADEVGSGARAEAHGKSPGKSKSKAETQEDDSDDDVVEIGTGSKGSGRRGSRGAGAAAAHAGASAPVDDNDSNEDVIDADDVDTEEDVPQLDKMHGSDKAKAKGSHVGKAGHEGKGSSVSGAGAGAVSSKASAPAPAMGGMMAFLQSSRNAQGAKPQPVPEQSAGRGRAGAGAAGGVAGQSSKPALSGRKRGASADDDDDDVQLIESQRSGRDADHDVDHKPSAKGKTKPAAASAAASTGAQRKGNEHDNGHDKAKAKAEDVDSLDEASISDSSDSDVSIDLSVPRGTATKLQPKPTAQAPTTTSGLASGRATSGQAGSAAASAPGSAGKKRKTGDR